MEVRWQAHGGKVAGRDIVESLKAKTYTWRTKLPIFLSEAFYRLLMLENNRLQIFFYMGGVL